MKKCRTADTGATGSAPLVMNVPSEKELSKIAERLSTLPLLGRSLGLVGPLGAGKTTFTRHLLAALGSPDAAASPSFTLSHEYRLTAGASMEHWDLYRLSSIPDELFEATEASVVRVVEWADKFPEYAEELDMVIAIEFGKMDPQNEERVVKVSGKEALVSLLRESSGKAEGRPPTGKE